MLMFFVIIFAVDFSKGGHQQGSSELLFINSKQFALTWQKLFYLTKTDDKRNIQSPWLWRPHTGPQSEGRRRLHQEALHSFTGVRRLQSPGFSRPCQQCSDMYPDWQLRPMRVLPQRPCNGCLSHLSARISGELVSGQHHCRDR